MPDRGRGRGRVGRSAWVLLILILVAAPGGVVAKRQSDPSGGTLIGAFDVGPGGCVECFNPLHATSGFAWLEKYYSKLIQYDIDFTQFQGDLAESWEIAPDGASYTLNLRPGVTWHDGAPFTSADVKFTLELVTQPDSASYLSGKYTGATSIETPDELTVVIALAEPNAAFLDALTFLAMLPKHELESIAPADLVVSDWWRTSPVGTGPFKWSQHQPGEFVELVAFDDYWRGRPQLDTIINRYFPEAGSAVIALRAGDIAFTYLTADEARTLEGDQEFQILSGPSRVTNFLSLNHQDPRFQDVRVRQALMYAIDRQAIVDELFQGAATVVPCVFSNEQYLAPDANPYSYDVARATALLEEAGWSQDEPIEVLTYYSDQLSTDIMVTMQQMLAEVGIEITLRALDGPAFTQLSASGEWTAAYVGLLNGPDPDATSIYFISTQTPPTGGNNAYVNVPELDSLYLDGRRETDPAARAEIYRQACLVHNEQATAAWMWVGDRFGAVAADVGNFIWTPAPAGGRYYDAAETWTVAES